jgi:uncharacterized protein YciI
LFIVLLKFSANRNLAGQYMDSHKSWLQHGFDDGIFLLAGSLQPAAGGVVLAHGCTRAALEERVNADPFVVHGVVSAECMEVAPSRASEQLSFLLT